MRRLLSRRESATTIVSYTLVAPLFLFMIFGITESARVYNAWVVITNEAREAARYGAVRYDSSGSAASQQTAVLQYLDQRLTGSVDKTHLQPAPVARVTTDGVVDVTVSYEVEIVIPMISAVLPNPFPIQARSIMLGEPGS
jgi:Flp pilus assembly protein TadG